MMMLGHFAMAFEPLLFPALALVALGNGLFIPPLAVQVGRLYQDGDARRDQAFSAYYMGINLGGFVALLLCGWLARDLSAGTGASPPPASAWLIGLVIYLGFRRLRAARSAARARPRSASARRCRTTDRSALFTLLGVIAVVVLFRIAYEQSGNTIMLWVSDRTDAFASAAGRFRRPGSCRSIRCSSSC